MDRRADHYVHDGGRLGVYAHAELGQDLSAARCGDVSHERVSYGSPCDLRCYGHHVDRDIDGRHACCDTGSHDVYGIVYDTRVNVCVGLWMAG